MKSMHVRRYTCSLLLGAQLSVQLLYLLLQVLKVHSVLSVKLLGFLHSKNPFVVMLHAACVLYIWHPPSACAHGIL